MIRRAGAALVGLAALLILLAEVQRADDLALQQAEPEYRIFIAHQ